MDDGRYRSILKQYWGYDDFRGVQLPIIQSIGAGNDTLGLMPTGGGKSITFQVPALATEGLCLVVTPLIALMKDQVDHLCRRGIKATAIYSGLTHEQVVVALENCIFGDYKFLYVSPERLSSQLFLSKLSRLPISFITIDEAHCLSQWGYDFRPSYLQIAQIRKLLPGVPVLALTATATPEVVTDIQRQLCFRADNVFRMSFMRANLSYIVRGTDDKLGELIHILKSLQGSAIVYTRNRQNCRQTAELLVEKGFSATYYHAGLDHAEKDLRQRAWQDDEVRVMVATNAFGMGIDKPDVRLVVHLEVPDSIEAYFQEAGRAGRDGNRAYAVLLHATIDRRKLHKRIADNFPEKSYIRDVYEDVCCYLQVAVDDGYGVRRQFELADFCHKFNRSLILTDSALRILTRAGYLEYTDEEENASRVKLLLSKSDLYRLHALSADEEKVLNGMLRVYGGVFSDFVFIDERSLATLLELKTEVVYRALLFMARSHVLQYIPRKRIPHIAFPQNRVDKRLVVLDAVVYDRRKENLRTQIDHILHYAESTDFCRSKLLLDYFGEHTDTDCGCCDVCIARKTAASRRREMEQEIAGELLRLLSDGARHAMSACELPGYDREQVAGVIRLLLDERKIELEEGYYLVARATPNNTTYT